MYLLMFNMNDILKATRIWLLHNINCMREKKETSDQSKLEKCRGECLCLGLPKR